MKEVLSKVEDAMVCAKEEKEKEVTHFVLVHGCGGGAWCWYKIRCYLEKSGYKVSCPDLKSAGIDPTSPNSIHTFEEYNKPLIDLLSSIPETEKVILVGHSAGGLSVTHAIHKFGKKIHLAIFVAATMLRCGFWTDQDYKDGVPDLSEYGDIYDLEFENGADQPPTSSVIKQEFQRKISYHMTPPEDSTLSAMLTKPGPLQGILDAKFTESPWIDEVTRVFIKTMYDRVMKPEQQEAMIKRWPPCDVFVLESDHNPVFSTPLDLFGILVKTADDAAQLN